MKPSKPDIDALLALALTWLLMLTYLALLYVLLISIGSGLTRQPAIDFEPPWWVNLFALGISAPTFLPVHRWLRLGVRELVYSQHEQPYPALARLNQQLESGPSPHAVLPNIAESMARALKLPYLEIETQLSDENPAASPAKIRFGSPVRGAAVVRLPLERRGTRMGEILVSARSAGETLSSADLDVLYDMARHLVNALYTTRLSEDLQRAREQLVIAREEERRRIRNDLHDGLAPTLSSLQIQLGAVRSQVRQDPERAEALLHELRDDLRLATAEIRRLVYDLRPPKLDDLGLVGALKSIRFQQEALQLEVTAPDPLPSLPAAVEVAAYRIAGEAIHNVDKHAQARLCEVQISVDDGWLTLRVIDNGTRIPGDVQPGVGLRSMHERALELGGTLSIEAHTPAGTCVTARLPLERSGVIGDRELTWKP